MLHLLHWIDVRVLGHFLKLGPTISEDVDALLAAANDAQSRRDLPAAALLYRRATAIDPSRADAFYKLGNTQKDLGLLSDALVSYDSAIKRDGAFMQAYCNRGVVFHRMGELAAAQASLGQAIALEPKDAISHYNMALVLQDCAKWREALASYDQCIGWNPAFADAQYNRALLLLSLGEFSAGWRAYEWRWNVADRLSIGERPNFSQQLWLGEQSIAGRRLLLHSEGGLGDTIQFSRYAPLCAALGAHVDLQVQAPLVALLKSLAGVDQVFTTGTVPPAFDLHCPLMSLPLAFRTTLQSIPGAAGYLSANAERVAYWRERLGRKKRPRVGLAWSGNSHNSIDKRRSIRLCDWLPHLPDVCDYYCLQTDIREQDQQSLVGSAIVSFPVYELDFVNTAALCQNLDLVISVDTSVAHLSGALNRATWILLPNPADWRWLQRGTDSLWYRNMQLYRQGTPNEWSDVMRRVSRDLASLFSG